MQLSLLLVVGPSAHMLHDCCRKAACHCSSRRTPRDDRSIYCALTMAQCRGKRFAGLGPWARDLSVVDTRRRNCNSIAWRGGPRQCNDFGRVALAPLVSLPIYVVPPMRLRTVRVRPWLLNGTMGWLRVPAESDICSRTTRGPHEGENTLYRIDTRPARHRRGVSQVSRLYRDFPATSVTVKFALDSKSSAWGGRQDPVHPAPDLPVPGQWRTRARRSNEAAATASRGEEPAAAPNATL